MAFDYSNKVIVVTGGSGALGKAVVDAYLKTGAQVISTTHNQPQNTNSNPLFFQLDALSEESVSSFFKELDSRFGSPAGVVNLIGGYKAGQPVTDLALEEVQNQFDLNLKSAFLVTKYALPLLEKQGGSLVHVSSRAALDKGKNAFAYSMSKQGVIKLVEAAAAEVKKKNISINAILPGIIDTPANRQAMPDADFSNWPRPEEIARVLLFLTSPDARIISGAAIPVYGKS